MRDFSKALFSIYLTRSFPHCGKASVPLSVNHKYILLRHPAIGITSYFINIYNIK